MSAEDQQIMAVSSVDVAIEKWLEATFVRSQSERTVCDYRKMAGSFRTYLQDRGLDLDGYAGIIRLHAQTWAGLRSPLSRRLGVVSGATYNVRLATLSSFYQYAKTALHYQGDNPIDVLVRTKVQKYGKARPLDPKNVLTCLKAIDRSTLQGKRDYVLLQVALNTGRRAQELASLRWKHLTIQGEAVTLTFEECKGHKTMYDTLSPRLSRALLSYLDAAYEGCTQMKPDSPIWLSLSDRNQRQAIGMQSIANICMKHLGVSTVHSMRHTFAHTLEELGASASEIQARLGHESLATTGIYLARLKSSYNPYADKLAEAFGVEEE